MKTEDLKAIFGETPIDGLIVKLTQENERLSKENEELAAFKKFVKDLVGTTEYDVIEKEWDKRQAAISDKRRNSLSRW